MGYQMPIVEGAVVAVSRNETHSFGKGNVGSIRLLAES